MSELRQLRSDDVKSYRNTKTAF